MPKERARGDELLTPSTGDEVLAFWLGTEAAREDIAELGIEMAMAMRFADVPAFELGYRAHVQGVKMQEAARWVQQATA